MRRAAGAFLYVTVCPSPTGLVERWGKGRKRSALPFVPAPGAVEEWRAVSRPCPEDGEETLVHRVVVDAPIAAVDVADLGRMKARFGRQAMRHERAPRMGSAIHPGPMPGSTGVDRAAASRDLDREQVHALADRGRRALECRAIVRRCMKLAQRRKHAPAVR